MESLEASVVKAMDGQNIDIFPFLPYILQDSWEIGASPRVIIELVRKYAQNYPDFSILDLGCGKGVVSIHLAREFKCSVLGIDGIHQFIDLADHKALEYQVNTLCRFEVNDIRARIHDLSQFDVIILGSIGPVFGDYISTLTTLAPHLTDGGLIIVDDGYIDDSIGFTNSRIPTKTEIMEQINEVGMRLVDEYIFTPEEIKVSNDQIFCNLKKRCFELMDKYPDKKTLFDNYILNQETENEILETQVISSTMVIMMK